MKNILLYSVMLAFSISSLSAQSFRKTDQGIEATVGDQAIEIQFFTPATVRVVKYPQGTRPGKQSLSVIKHPEEVKFNVRQKSNQLTLSSAQLSVGLDLSNGRVAFTDKAGRALFAEKENTTFSPTLDAGNETYVVKQVFRLDKDEAIYGLGQHQQGRMSQRNQELFLRQENMEICIPLIHSVKGYAVFWDNYSPTTFIDNEEGMSFESVVGDCSDYYFMYGGNADGVIAEIRDLTGQAPMFPLWTYGFWQSKERYGSQKEIVGVVEKYRSLGIPLDGIIQDWQYWSTNNKYWNAMEFGNPEFPDPKAMIDQIHQLNAHIMISVWASFGPKTKPYAEFNKDNLLMGFEPYPHNVGAEVYDVYHPKARDIYWRYMNENMFKLGMDAWWLDSTEPDHSQIKESDFDYQTYLGSFRKVRNAFPLATVGGVYDHQRAETSDKRVFILTRSAFTGQQRYGANSWSGDVFSDWTTLRNQISAGMNFCLTGIPYWNTDIGGFWTWRSYPKGVADVAYHELYVRWMQFATFTPMMRSHGSNTPREIFNFGKKGDWAFDAQEKMINLRYRLLPYIYATSWDVTHRAGTMMRALFMDFPKDKTVYNIDNEFMFGRSLLVAPVTDSLYVARSNGEAIVDFGQVRQQRVYLPEGSHWIDFWTGESWAGGQELARDVPIDLIPLYVKSGSILPLAPFAQYAEEKRWDNLEVRIYPGANGEFTLYEDENDNYNYEKGQYSTITFKWNDKKRELTIGERKGAFPAMLQKRNFRLILVAPGNGTGIDLSEATGADVNYNGETLKVVL
ncbi:TIM-barrel domain-containing protein [Bacteroides sp. 51]|uniref:glycoside hydrolase family 31 protein n=1 Tax=Bacteroides sp. 51 TaxID=2302938 RepID=UPI0013D8924C|nr:TIM-barrel domain-containing protein [Bacteroides sp. 51]NDV84054.1 DUF5110 domain-containing protein [Bacteroides sp. 51]